MDKEILGSNTPLPERLREGRKYRGITQIELAEQLEISKQAISQYELGSSNPKPDVFEKICNILELPYNYFFKEIPYNKRTPIFFRRGKSAVKRDYESFESRVGWVREIYYYLNGFIEFPKVNLITKESEKYSFDEIMEIAVEVRRFWGLGQGPISNMVLLLENNGIIVSKVSVGAKRVDACSVLDTNSMQRPIVFLTPDTSAVRSRRDAAHELAHHVLHSWADKEYFAVHRERMDKEAEWFASAFLMPPEAIKRESYGGITIEKLLLLKKRWKTAAQSILYYMNDLELINENQFQYLRKKIYSRGWRISEPYDDVIAQEEPLMLKQALELILDHNIVSIEKLLEDLPFPSMEIERLCNLERNMLVNKKVPILKLIK